MSYQSSAFASRSTRCWQHKAGLQGAWELMHDFKARGPAALADWHERAAKSPFGLADYKSLTGHRDVRAIEESFLPVGERRDYRAR